MPTRSTPTYQNILVLTGAGVSVESGLSTFRAAGGLWAGHRVEEVATPEAFARSPATVHRFYNERRSKLHTVAPNAAHRALAEFAHRAARESRTFTLVTQNVDDLHERAGSPAVVHMHGELLQSRCTACGTRAPVTGDLTVTAPCPHCRAPGGRRPDIVWFGEMPYFMERIERALAVCDCFAAIGTSGHVYPAAGFVDLARRAGAHCVEINTDTTANASLFHETITAPATTGVPGFFDTL